MIKSFQYPPGIVEAFSKSVIDNNMYQLRWKKTYLNPSLPVYTQSYIFSDPLSLPAYARFMEMFSK